MTDAPRHNTILLDHDGDHYVLRIVVSLYRDGTLQETYCDWPDWPSTLAGQLAAERARVTELEAQVATLATASTTVEPVSAPDDDDPPEYTCSVCGKRFATPRALAVHQKRAHTAQSGRLTCNTCGRTFASSQGRGAHESKCRGTPKVWPVTTATRPEPESLQVTVDPPKWRCVQCNTDTFAPDFHEPEKCQKCTGSYAAALRRNGKEVAV